MPTKTPRRFNFDRTPVPMVKIARVAQAKRQLSDKREAVKKRKLRARHRKGLRSYQYPCSLSPWCSMWSAAAMALAKNSKPTKKQLEVSLAQGFLAWAQTWLRVPGDSSR